MIAATPRSGRSASRRLFSGQFRLLRQRGPKNQPTCHLTCATDVQRKQLRCTHACMQGPRHHSCTRSSRSSCSATVASVGMAGVGDVVVIADFPPPQKLPPPARHDAAPTRSKKSPAKSIIHSTIISSWPVINYSGPARAATTTIGSAQAAAPSLPPALLPPTELRRPLPSSDNVTLPWHVQHELRGDR